MSQITIIYTTISSLHEAESLAEQIITNKLAACANIIPSATSIYEWEGKIEKTTECLIIFKTATQTAERLCDYIRHNHPYSVPAILQGSIETTESFYDFIKANTTE